MSSAEITSFHGTVTADGSSGFKAEKGRYHLFGGNFCPWAGRAMIVRRLKGLEDVIGLTIVRPEMGDDGWPFGDGSEGCDPDPIKGFPGIKQLYLHAEPEYKGRFTVPMLYDKHTNKIVNNESAELVRILNTAFNEFSATPEQAALDLYPEAKRAEIDEINGWVLSTINTNIYKCSMPSSDEEYEAAISTIFKSLDRIEEILSKQRFVAGDNITEADVRLIVSLLRFNIMPFQTSVRRLKDFPNILNYVRELYQMDAIGGSTDFKHTEIALGNYLSKHGKSANQQNEAEFTQAHNRATVAA
jgi:putative glutathione S-transferase